MGLRAAGTADPREEVSDGHVQQPRQQSRCALSGGRAMKLATKLPLAFAAALLVLLGAALFGIA